MRISGIDFFEIANGENVGVSLYTQGCPRHCKGCFQTKSWDFDGGDEYTKELEEELIKSCLRDGIKRLTILGGEPLLERNREDLINLCKSLKSQKPDINIWLYTGNTFEEIIDEWKDLIEPYIDVMIDGPFELDKRDITLKFRGSSNQRIIDIHETLKKGEVVIYHE